MATGPHVFTALDQVRQDIDALGISKKREVKDGVRFKFRGIDDVMDTFSGPMARAKLLATPHFGGRVVTERVTAGGKANYNTSVEGSIEFTSLVDGSKHVAGPFYGEANDTGDKSTAKAQSISFRQGMLLTFVVPLGPAMDPEADEDQQRDAADDKPAAEKPAKGGKSKAAAKAGGKAGVHGLSESQLRVLTIKRDQANLDDKGLLELFPSIGPHNINEVLNELKRRAD